MNACRLRPLPLPETCVNRDGVLSTASRSSHGSSIAALKSTSRFGSFRAPPRNRNTVFTIYALTEEKTKAEGGVKEDLDEVTKKWGLELGLWKALTNKNGEDNKKENQNSAKALLAKYGIAYLATSISLSIISFSLFYFLIDSGVDVQSLLANVGITVDSTGEKVGTVALAYAAHKAASPIRFPPTVFLTPFVANLMGKKVEEDAKAE